MENRRAVACSLVATGAIAVGWSLALLDVFGPALVVGMLLGAIVKGWAARAEDEWAKAENKNGFAAYSGVFNPQFVRYFAPTRARKALLLLHALFLFTIAFTVIFMIARSVYAFAFCGEDGCN